MWFCTSGGFCTWGVSVTPSASHPTPHHGEPGKPGLPEQVPEPKHCRVGTSAACCCQRGRLLALSLQQQLPRHCPGASRCSRLCTLIHLCSASAWAAGESPKPVFLRAIWTLLVGQPCYKAWELVIWGQA